MIYQVCVVYDSVAKIYKTPMFFINTAQAERSFANEANRPESEIAAHPADFSLVHIGEFDEEEGKLIPLDQPTSLGLAVKYKNPEPSPD